MPTSTFQYMSSSVLVAVAVLFLQSCTEADRKAETHVKADMPAKPQADESKSLPTVPVKSGVLTQTLDLPGELSPFRDVKIHAKVKGFVSWIGVDRGSRVRAGQVLIKLSAPELDAQCKESHAKVTAARAAHAEALSTLEADRAGYVELQAKLDSDALTLKRLKQAASEPGAIAQNEIDTAEKSVEADQARLKAATARVIATESVVAAKLQAVKAAESSLESLEEMRAYLVIKSPLDGLITERWVHEGDIAGVEQGRSEDARPLLRLVQTNTLRLVVFVPESRTAGISEGARLDFTVPAYLGKQFSGTVKRIGHALDVHTRTMPVELDVNNKTGELEPGMYATVKWRVRRPYATAFVPTSAVASNMEHTFVVAVEQGKTRIVPVKTGQTMGDNIEIVGPLMGGDIVLLKASDEYKEGAAVSTRPARADDIDAACQHHATASSE